MTAQFEKQSFEKKNSLNFYNNIMFNAQKNLEWNVTEIYTFK